MYFDNQSSDYLKFQISQKNFSRKISVFFPLSFKTSPKSIAHTFYVFCFHLIFKFVKIQFNFELF